MSKEDKQTYSDAFDAIVIPANIAVLGAFGFSELVGGYRLCKSLDDAPLVLVYNEDAPVKRLQRDYDHNATGISVS